MLRRRKCRRDGGSDRCDQYAYGQPGIQHKHAEHKRRQRQQAESTSIDPSEKKSGITILPEGVNKIRLTNEYRRGVKVWIDQIAYVPKGGGAWVQSKMPLTEFEIKPVNGLKYTIGVLSDIAAALRRANRRSIRRSALNDQPARDAQVGGENSLRSSGLRFGYGRRRHHDVAGQSYR